MQCWRALSAAVFLDYDFHILVESDEEAQQALHGKLPELAAQHFGDVGLFDAEEIGGFGLLQAAFFHEAVDLEHELRLDQVLLRVRHAQILEHVPASGGVWSLAHEHAQV
jgi:hypothetical protein